jgi:hypothetical protein
MGSELPGAELAANPSQSAIRSAARIMPVYFIIVFIASRVCLYLSKYPALRTSFSS